MVNPDSPSFRISEKIGIIIGKGIRYVIVGGIVFILTGKIRGSKAPSSVPSPPAPPPG